MMRSESTSALGHPSDVNDIRGALFMYRLEPASELFGYAIQLIASIAKFND
jgi:hypothetical protein